MRFLIDNALSPIVSKALKDVGHDALHVRERGLQTAMDADLMTLALAEDRIIVSADTDFGTLLALRQAAKPSIILFRHGVERYPQKQASLLLRNLPAIEHDLLQGAVVTFEPGRIRIRSLPIGAS